MVADIIKEIRYELGLTQPEFAELIGYPMKSLQNWEQGYCEPKARVMIKILQLGGKLL